MNKHVFRTLAGLSVAGLLATGASVVQAQQVVQARVISATPIRETTGSDVSYNVTYEYNGRQYTTRTNSRPGATIAIQASAYGVTTAPVAPQAQLQPYPVEADNGQQYQQYQQYQPYQQYQQPPQYSQPGSPWDNVVPEPGVVVSDAPAAPVYAPPVYVQPAYTYPYAYPPVGISLNLGYSRGWGGYRGYGGYGYRHWR
ncbi:hypothetical protein VAPA_1c38940 [Variovorax paradoxus B4]|uniref:Uncharacterized protein n=1 Tax=Variovorax paradoxus B4 TaxID=1246301 RepID=T1XEI7_VARPD|nr:hypothetical protein [Variovorax paradoxus]AGU50973.1 hypothetical protein VAPA_1c38940 [Variovorax paradoxus B4]